jgi:hypothetical protein
MAEYFARTAGYKADEACSREQAEIIGTAIVGSGMIQSVAQALYNSCDDRPGIGVDSVIATALLAGFNIGRDFEIRSLAKAMREEVPRA